MRCFAARSCDLLAVSAAAGEEDEVGTGVDEGGGLFGTVVQHLHQITRQICLRAEPRDESGCFGRALGTLEHHRVAGDERGDERNHGKLQRVIRWAEDQSNSVRLEMCLEARTAEEK